jgi:hypothetical protein
MRSKPADLSASLVAIKGTAAPSPDMPGRAGGLAPVAAVPPAPPPRPAAADAEGQLPRATAAAPRPSRPARRLAPKPNEVVEANLAPLNFRIAPSFRREFKSYAAQHDLKLNELLRLCFDAYRKQQRD